MSRCPEDILFALRSGHGYVKMAPEMPDVEVRAGEGILGDTVPAGSDVAATFTGLRAGDKIRTITDQAQQETVVPENGREMTLHFCDKGAKFVRYEVVRAILKGVPEVRVLVSNPVYFGVE